ncbi:MAG: hypothetical protein OXE45_15300 [bacterium]|nr:hypothetical protein [bacterium]
MARTQGGLTPPKVGTPDVVVAADGLSAEVLTPLHTGAAVKGGGQARLRRGNIKKFLRGRRRKIQQAARDAAGSG